MIYRLFLIRKRITIMLLVLLFFFHYGAAKKFSFQGIPNQRAFAHENTIRLQSDLSKLTSGDIYTLPHNTYYLMGGLRLQDSHNITIFMDATLHFSTRSFYWPKNPLHQYLPCLSFNNVSHIRITSHSQGIWNGEADAWWNIYPLNHNHFPIMWTIFESHHVHIDHITFVYAPYWNVWVERSYHIQLSHLHILMKRSSSLYHTWVDALDSNTHGILLQGEHLSISNTTVWGEGHSILVQGYSAYVSIQQVNLSGRGLTIVSKQNHTVRYVHVQNVYFYKSLYGILVYANGNGYMEHIHFESITMDENRDWSIWVQSHPYCHDIFFRCDLSPFYVFYNLTFQSIRLHNPRWNPGFILGDTLYSIFMENITYTYAPITTTRSVYQAFPTLLFHRPSLFFELLWLASAISCGFLLLRLFTDNIVRNVLLVSLLLFTFQHYYMGRLDDFIILSGVHIPK